MGKEGIPGNVEFFNILQQLRYDTDSDEMMKNELFIDFEGTSGNIAEFCHFRFLFRTREKNGNLLVLKRKKMNNNTKQENRKKSRGSLHQ